MVKFKDGKNTTKWRGTVVKPLVFSHEIKDKTTGEIVDTYRSFSIAVEVTTNKGKLLDVSELPMVVSDRILDLLEKPLSVNDVVFVRGSWRAYTVQKENTKRRVEQVGFVQHLSHTELVDGKSLNRFEFEGYVVGKLFVREVDENGRLILDENGKSKPALDENGKKQYTVRLNKEKKIVNDYHIAINRGQDKFYIPSLSYFNMAKKIAEEIPDGAHVTGSGYIRSRSIRDGEHTVYEAVVVGMDIIEDEVETI
jgi:hypothetical protein